MREPFFYEKAIVGAILNDASTLDIVGDQLINHPFVDPVCAVVFSIAYELRSKGCNTAPVDVLRRAIELGRDSEIGMLELNRLSLEDACIKQSVSYYLDELLEIDARYAAKKAFKQALEMLDGEVMLEDVFLHVEACRNRVQKSELGRVSVQDAIRRVAEEARKPRSNSIPCKIGKLDKILGGGFHIGELSIIAARPSVGKTSFAAQAALEMSTSFPTLFISLEMSADDIARRFVAHFGGPTFNDLRSKQISVEEFGECIRVPVGGRELYLSESKSASLSAIVAQIRSSKATCGVRAVVIDYLGFVSHDRKLKRWEEVGVITKQLKQIANSEQVAIILLSQLTRDIESNKRPQLSHLRESGSVEQDADLVLFLYRESDDGSDRIVEIAKNRNGELLATKMEFVGEKFLFREPSNEWKP